MNLLKRTVGGSSSHRAGVNLLRGTVEVILIEGRNLAIRDSCGNIMPFSYKLGKVYRLSRTIYEVKI